MASASSHRTEPREAKRERMELRGATSAKTLIKRAMAVSGMTADEKERMKLPQADADAFLRAVAAPPAPVDRLIKAFERHKSVVG